MFMRVLVCLLVVIPFTAVYCLVPAAVALVLLVTLIFLFMPLMLFYGLATAENCKYKCIGYIALVIFYPVIGSFFALVTVIVVLLYPYARNKYHHGIYDPFDLIVSQMAIWYLRFIKFTIFCCLNWSINSLPDTSIIYYKSLNLTYRNCVLLFWLIWSQY